MIFALSTPDILLANPKSQIFTLQSSFTSTLAGFKSLWMTLAECRYLTAHNRLYTTVWMCLIYKCIALLMTFLRSDSASSRTTYSVSNVSAFFGSITSNILITYGCYIFLSKSISLKILLQSTSSSKTPSIFFIATFFPVGLWIALQTAPYDP
jgi:hypothetical protein